MTGRLGKVTSSCTVEKNDIYRYENAFLKKFVVVLEISRNFSYLFSGSNLRVSNKIVPVPSAWKRLKQVC